MLFKEMMDKERSDGRKEGQQINARESVLELLKQHGVVPEDIEDKINRETDFSVLKRWLIAAAKSESIEDFRGKIETGLRK